MAAAAYSSWNNWTPGTEFCGGGQQYRHRECNKVKSCDGPYNDTRACALEECPATGPSKLKHITKLPLKSNYGNEIIL
ncbi:unnamed protein product [Clavelina lepadiformis]|uniref:Uncharacterized protein n=1 Tax=Clavelina lepadiformis TaxID=159417 RepID=A0ABP0F1X6_CLALP